MLGSCPLIMIMIRSPSTTVVPSCVVQVISSPAPVIATRDDLLAVALTADVVALYRSRLPRDPYALSKPLELQVRTLILACGDTRARHMLCPSLDRDHLHPQKYARPLCLALLVLVVAWNVARARVARRKRKSGRECAPEAGLRALLGGNMGSLTNVPGDPLSASLFGGTPTDDEDTLLPEQLAALLGGHDFDSASGGGALRESHCIAEGFALGNASFGPMASEKPLQPHQLAALLRDPGHNKGSWSSEDEIRYSDESSLG